MKAGTWRASGGFGRRQRRPEGVAGGRSGGRVRTGRVTGRRRTVAPVDVAAALLAQRLLVLAVRLDVARKPLVGHRRPERGNITNHLPLPRGP